MIVLYVSYRGLLSRAVRAFDTKKPWKPRGSKEARSPVQFGPKVVPGPKYLDLVIVYDSILFFGDKYL